MFLSGPAPDIGGDMRLGHRRDHGPLDLRRRPFAPKTGKETGLRGRRGCGSGLGRRARRDFRTAARAPRLIGHYRFALRDFRRRSRASCVTRHNGIFLRDSRSHSRTPNVTRHDGILAHDFRAPIRTPSVTRSNGLLPRNLRPRSRVPRVARHNNFFLREFELMMRGVEDLLAMSAAHASVMRREQVRIEAENGIAMRTAGCQRHV